METNWTLEKIEALEKACRKQIENKRYAQTIADKIQTLKELNDQVRRAYEIDLSYDELEIMWKMQSRMELSIIQMVKAFFRKVYDGQNSFTDNLKGKSYLDHYFAFKDFVEGMIFNVKVA